MQDSTEQLEFAFQEIAQIAVMVEVVINEPHSLRNSKCSREENLTRISVWLQLTQNLNKTPTAAAALDP